MSKPLISLYVKKPIQGQKPEYTSVGAGFPHKFTFDGSPSPDGRITFDLALSAKSKVGQGYVKIISCQTEDGQTISLTDGFPAIAVDLAAINAQMGNDDGEDTNDEGGPF